MTEWIVLVLLSPFLLFVVVFGAVVVVALCHAKPEDVPAVLKECAAIFRRVLDRIPGNRSVPADPPRAQNAIDSARPEETP